MHNQKVGKIGEQYAEKFLLSKGWIVIQKNHHCRYGELDLIAFDYSNDQLIFIEVKTRIGNYFGTPEEAVDWRKKDKIIKAALHFLSESRGKFGRSWRIDLIAVKLTQDLKLKEINHLTNIFDG